MHLILAGLPSGIPGIGDEIEGAIQQAPQFGRHSISCDEIKNIKIRILSEQKEPILLLATLCKVSISGERLSQVVYDPRGRLAMALPGLLVTRKAGTQPARDPGVGERMSSDDISSSDDRKQYGHERFDYLRYGRE